MVIRVIGGLDHLSASDVREVWNKWVREGRCQNAPTRSQPLEAEDSIPAYVNEGRWVADCPACNGGMATSPEHAHSFCADCGTIYAVEHPPAGLIRQAENVLQHRQPRNRNWLPDREDIPDLQAENVLRGLPFGRGR